MSRRIKAERPDDPGLTDQERAEIERDCRRCGVDPELAALVADRVGEVTEPPPGHPAAESRSRPRAAASKAENLRAVVASFGASALTLIPDFERAGLPLRNVLAVLDRATGNAREIGPAGIGQVRMALLQRSMVAAANDE